MLRDQFNSPFVLRFRRLAWGFLVSFMVSALILPSSGRADGIRLRNGNVLDGTILDRNEAQIILDHPDLGRLTIPMNAIDSISVTGEAEDKSTAQTAGTSSDVHECPGEVAAANEKTPAMPDETAEPESKWSMGVVFGGTLTNDDEGEKASFNTRGIAERKVPGFETNIRLSYLFKVDDGEVDENNLTGTFQQLWLKMDSPWLYFASGRYDYDKFQSWRQRIQSQGGMGYRFVDREGFRIFPLAGLGLRKDIGSIEEVFSIEALTGIRLNWESKSHQRLEVTAVYFRAINEDEYRFVNTIEWKIPVLRMERFSFNTHLDHEYASNPDPGFPPNKIRLTWGLQWDF